jgi:hypothetical protein
MPRENPESWTDSQFVQQDAHMNKRRSRSAPALSPVNEILESRIVLSSYAPAQGAAEVAARAVHKVATTTTLAVTAGTLGQPITFNVTVRAPAAAGSPQGTVNITDHGKVIQTLTLTPTTSTNARYAYSEATYTLVQQPGGSANYFGKYSLSASYVPNGAFLKSQGNRTFTVGEPTFTPLSDGVEIATTVPGSGAEIQSGQTASVLYTGYLAKSGKIFDDSINDGGTPFSFTLGAGQVIPGFDAGIAGMQVGESRIILIPPAEAYGKAANGTIPANSTLIFVVTLESIT